MPRRWLVAGPCTERLKRGGALQRETVKHAWVFRPSRAPELLLPPKGSSHLPCRVRLLAVVRDRVFQRERPGKIRRVVPELPQSPEMDCPASTRARQPARRPSTFGSDRESAPPDSLL